MHNTAYYPIYLACYIKPIFTKKYGNSWCVENGLIRGIMTIFVFVLGAVALSIFPVFCRIKIQQFKNCIFTCRWKYNSSIVGYFEIHAAPSANFLLLKLRYSIFQKNRLCEYIAIFCSHFKGQNVNFHVPFFKKTQISIYKNVNFPSQFAQDLKLCI